MSDECCSPVWTDRTVFDSRQPSHRFGGRTLTSYAIGEDGLYFSPVVLVEGSLWATTRPIPLRSCRRHAPVAQRFNMQCLR